MKNGVALVRYDAMVSAIVACHSVDEVKDIHDKALALEVYAKQAKNIDAERKAADVRLRAERRSGELLKELARATPQDRANAANVSMGRSSNGETNDSPYAAALERTGMSRQTASRYQALANVPSETFESHLADPQRKPTTTRIIAEARGDDAPKLDDRALWVWGRARDFERDGYDSLDAGELLAKMTNTMRADMARIVPRLLDFYESMSEHL